MIGCSIRPGGEEFSSPGGTLLPPPITTGTPRNAPEETMPDPRSAGSLGAGSHAHKKEPRTFEDFVTIVASEIRKRPKFILQRGASGVGGPPFGGGDAGWGQGCGLAGGRAVGETFDRGGESSAFGNEHRAPRPVFKQLPAAASPPSRRISE